MRKNNLNDVTADTIRLALADFPLPLVDGWDHQTLADEIRAGLAFVARPLSFMNPDRLENAEIRKTIEALAGRTLQLHNDFQELSKAVVDRLYSHSYEVSGNGNYLAHVISDATAIADFWRSVAHLRSLGSFGNYILELASFGAYYLSCPIRIRR